MKTNEEHAIEHAIVEINMDTLLAEQAWNELICSISSTDGGTPTEVIVQPSFLDQEASSGEKTICRICHDGEEDGEEQLVAPCKCTGSMAWVHRSCLQHWLTTSRKLESRRFCEVCKHEYKTVLKPPHFLKYLKPKLSLRVIINLLTILLMLVVITWSIVKGMEAILKIYETDIYEYITWLSIDIFVLLVFAMICIVFVVKCVRYNHSMWRRWQVTDPRTRVILILDN